ncbi:hypothetical protein KSS87_018188, partial [Heliosperma pusillum]
MAMKAAMMTAISAATKPRGLNRLCTTSAFNFTPPQPSSQQPAAPVADPSPNLFVSGLSKRTTTDGLREAFSKFGEVVHAKVVTDHVSGFSKGFGFVKYATIEEASSGIEGMNGASMQNHDHRLHISSKMEALPLAEVDIENLEVPGISFEFRGAELSFVIRHKAVSCIKVYITQKEVIL